MTSNNLSLLRHQINPPQITHALPLPVKNTQDPEIRTPCLIIIDWSICGTFDRWYDEIQRTGKYMGAKEIRSKREEIYRLWKYSCEGSAAAQ